MARRLPRGTVFGKSYSTAPLIQRDKPTADYMQLFKLGKGLGDEILPTVSELGALGIDAIVDAFSSTEQDNRQKAAGEMLGIAKKQPAPAPKAAKPDKPAPQSYLTEGLPWPEFGEPPPLEVERVANVDTLIGLMAKHGISDRDPRYKEALVTLRNKGAHLPEKVWTDMSKESLNRLITDPTYFGKDLLAAEVEPAPVTRRRPAEEATRAPRRLAPAASPPDLREVIDEGELTEREDSLDIIRRYNKIKGVAPDDNEENIRYLREARNDIGALEYSDDDLVRTAATLEAEVHEAEGLIERGQAKRREGIRQEAAGVRPAAALAESVQEDEAVAKFKERAAPMEKATAGAERLADPAQPLPLKSAEQAQQVIGRRPATQTATQRFQQGFIADLENVSFSEVRAFATLSDPRRMTRQQISALAERYRREAKPTSMMDLIRGEYKDRAEANLRKELGLYAGVTTASERAEQVTQASRAAIEGMKEAGRFKRWAPEYELKRFDRELARVKTVGELKKMHSDMFKNKAKIMELLSKSGNYDAAAVYKRLQSRELLVKVKRAEIRLKRMLTGNKKLRVETRSIPIPGFPPDAPGIMTLGVTYKGEWYPATSEVFHKLQSVNAVRLNKSQSAAIKEMSKTMLNLLGKKGKGSGVTRGKIKTLQGKVDTYAKEAEELAIDAGFSVSMKDGKTVVSKKGMRKDGKTNWVSLGSINIAGILDENKEEDRALRTAIRNMRLAQSNLDGARVDVAGEGKSILDALSVGDGPAGADVPGMPEKPPIQDLLRKIDLESMPHSQQMAYAKEMGSHEARVKDYVRRSGLSEDAVRVEISRGKVLRPDGTWTELEDPDL